MISLLRAARGQENEFPAVDTVEWLIGRACDRFLESRQ